MNDTPTPINLDELSDEEFLKLDPSTLQPYVAPTDSEVQPDVPADPVAAADDVPAGSGDEAKPADSPDQEPKPEGSEPPAPAGQEPFKGAAPQADPAAKPAPAKAPEKPAGDKPAAEGEKPKEPEKPDVTAQVASDFYKKVTAPFKADGKDIQVRSADDAVRLMQMGVNYSRRMAEMKPMRAQAEMLRINGLDHPDKLNFMIDVMKGKPEAIQKLLKDSKIDPIDVDVSKDTSNYKPTNHQVDPKTLAFREAIETTKGQEGGLELIRDINASWDDVSKEALRDQPAIFQNLLDQRRSGVYGQIKKELDYQRTMGFLTDVPFVQAYHQVGEAMQKAGVFGPNLTPKQTQVQSRGMAPIDTGPRKAVVPNTTPAPNLSSTQQPRVAPSSGQPTAQPDYWAMSDEEFLKLKPPG